MATQFSKKRLSKYMLDGVAFLFWFYVLVKVFVFDVDVYLIQKIAPTLTWILNLRLFVFLLLVAISWLSLGHKRFFLSFAYVIGYPLVVVFWKLPILIFRQWATFLVLLPSIFDALFSFRSTFILYVTILISAVAIFFFNNPNIIGLAMLGLFLSLIFVLYRAFGRTHSTRIYSHLAQFVRNMHARIENGEFDVPIVVPLATPSQEVSNAQVSPIFPQLYVHFVVFDFISQKVDQVDRQHKYNLILISSLLSVMFWAVLIFGLLHWSIYSLDPRAYSGTAGTSFFQFLAFSLGRLANTDLTEIHPISTLAVLLTSLQVICSILILVIGVFSIFTAQRDSFREDFKEFLSSLNKSVELVSERIGIKYSMSSSQLEMQIAVESLRVVNFLRRLRGLPEIESSDLDLSESETEDK